MTKSAIEEMVERLPAQTQDALRRGMLWNIRCALNYARKDKQEQIHLEEFVQEIEAQAPEWGAF